MLRLILYQIIVISELISPPADSADMASPRLPTRYWVRRRRRIFPDDVPQWRFFNVSPAEEEARRTGKVVRR